MDKFNKINHYEPLVSILIPVYNSEKWLEECLDSVIYQEYTNIEIIIINDGSYDNSPKICELYSKKYANIKFYSRTNKGVSYTRNELLQFAIGEYILFVDSDDRIHPLMVKNLLETAINNNSEITICDNFIIRNEIIYSSNITIPKQTSLNREKFIPLFIEHRSFRGSLWNKLIKKNIVCNNKFNEIINYGEDALFVWNCLKNTNRVSFCNDSLYYYRMNNDSISHQKFNHTKLSSYIVWNSILQDVRKDYPKLVELCQSRLCAEITILLYQAAQCNYNNKTDIDFMQNVIALYYSSLRRTKLVPVPTILFAYISTKSYFLSKIIAKFR